MPCLLLVKKGDNPVPESPGKWHDGEVVCVMEPRDIDTFSPKERLAFEFIYVADMTLEEGNEAYTRPYEHDTELERPEDPDSEKKVLGRRRIVLDRTNPAATALIEATRTERKDKPDHSDKGAEVAALYAMSHPTKKVIDDPTRPGKKIDRDLEEGEEIDTAEIGAGVVDKASLAAIAVDRKA